MDDEIKTLIKISRLKIKKLKKLNLFQFNNPNMFQLFLINQRIKRFQILKILEYSGFESNYLIGYDNVSIYDKSINGDQLVKKIGPCILEKTYDTKFIFDMVLGLLGIVTLVTGPYFDPKHGFISIKGILKSDEYSKDQGYDINTYEGGMIYLNKKSDLIITENEIYCDKTKLQDIKNIIQFHQTQFKNFLKKYKDQAVPHELYVELLLKWFPGIVQTRSLT